MNETKTAVIWSAGVIGGIVGEIFGAWDSGVTALFIFMCIDFVTGLINAALFRNSDKTISGALSSKVCGKGLARKICTLLLVAAAYQADRILGTDYIRNAVIFAFCAAELISICENASAMGILPKSVEKIFSGIIDVLENNDKDSDNDKEEA